MTFLEHIITPSSRRGKKPPESTASSLAVSFVGSGRNIPICLVAVGLHGNLKVHHIQIFGGSVMQKIQASKISSTNFEEWDKSRPISFLASPQEHRRGVIAWVQVNGGKSCWRYCAIDGMIHTTIWHLNFTFPEEQSAAMLLYSCVLTPSKPSVATAGVWELRMDIISITGRSIRDKSLCWSGKGNILLGMTLIRSTASSSSLLLENRISPSTLTNSGTSSRS